MVAVRVTITSRSVLFVLLMSALFAGIATCLMMSVVQFGLGCLDVPIAAGFYKSNDAGHRKRELPVQKHEHQHAAKKLGIEAVHSSRD
jgi:hypothetical protein